MRYQGKFQQILNDQRVEFFFLNITDDTLLTIKGVNATTGLVAVESKSIQSFD